MDADSGELLKDGSRVRIQDQPCKVLRVLLERPGELVSREELKQAIAPESTFGDFEHALNVAIGKLRIALNDSADKPLYIETLHKRGYRFIAPVAHVPPLAPDAINIPTSAAESARGADLAEPQGEGVRPLRMWTIRLLTFGAVLLAIGSGIFGYLKHLRPGFPKISSLAVLPLVNVSGDATQDYFADGMTDGLIASVSKIHGLRVISRTSVMQYKGTAQPLPRIARELNVDGIVEGTVLRSGTRIRITIQLLHAGSDTQLWSNKYERELGDVITLQDEVADDVARQIRATLTRAGPNQPTRNRSIDPAAYELYLKGRYYLNNRLAEKAAKNFIEAIKLQPDYAQAYAGLAASYAMYERSDTQLFPNEAMSRAKAAVNSAVDLDSSLADAHASLGWIKLNYDLDWAGAEEEFRQAVALNPSDETAHLWYGCELVWQTRFDEGLREMRRAQEVAPADPLINAFFGMGLYQARQYNTAIKQLQNAIELDRTYPPAHMWLGLTYLANGMRDEAIQELEQAAHFAKERHLRVSAALSRLGYAYGMTARKRDAIAILDELRSMSTRQYVPPVHIAVVYIGMGNKDLALSWLEKAYNEHSYELTLMNADPRFDSLRSEPRFQRLIRLIYRSQPIGQ